MVDGITDAMGMNLGKLLRDGEGQGGSHEAAIHRVAKSWARLGD